MDRRWRETFAAWAETDEYAVRLADARRAIRATCTVCSVVPFSGGKDSTVLLHLVAQSIDDFVVTHYDFGRPDRKAHNVFPAAIEREILDNGTMIAAKPLHVVTASKNWRDLAHASEDRPLGTIVHMIPPAVTWIDGSIAVAQSLGAQVNLVGLRRQESITRRTRIDRGQEIAPGTIPERWPIAHLVEMDIWAYIVSHNLPYCSLYDERAVVNGGYIGLRLTSLFRDPTKAKVDESSVDNVLHWRLRGR